MHRSSTTHNHHASWIINLSTPSLIQLLWSFLNLLTLTSNFEVIAFKLFTFPLSFNPFSFNLLSFQLVRMNRTPIWLISENYLLMFAIFLISFKFLSLKILPIHRPPLRLVSANYLFCVLGHRPKDSFTSSSTWGPFRILKKFFFTWWPSSFLAIKGDNRQRE